MTNNNQKSINYRDERGNQLIISKSREGSLNFTMHHGEIIEGGARKEYEDMSLYISPNSGYIYQVTQGLFDKLGERFVLSEDPIRDGRNFIYLEQQDKDYYLTIGRDLANELNREFQTKVSLSGQYYLDLYDDILNGRYEEPISNSLVKKI